MKLSNDATRHYPDGPTQAGAPSLWAAVAVTHQPILCAPVAFLEFTKFNHRPPWLYCTDFARNAFLPACRFGHGNGNALLCSQASNNATCVGSV